MNSIRQLNKQTEKGLRHNCLAASFSIFAGIAGFYRHYQHYRNKIINMEKILIGKITSAVGLKGEMKVYSYASSPQRFQSLERVWIDKDEYPLERSRTQKNMAVLKVSGVDDRDAAERMRGRSVFMSDEDLEELEEGAYYIRDLIGLNVVNEDTEEVIGTVKDVLTDRPQDIYVIRLEDGGEAMIPGVKSFIHDVDLKKKTIRVHLIDGMLG